MKVKISAHFFLSLVLVGAFVGAAHIYIKGEKTFQPMPGKAYPVKKLLGWIQKHQGDQAGFFALVKDGQPLTLTKLKNFTADIVPDFIDGSAPVHIIIKQVKDNISGELKVPSLDWAKENENKVVLHQASKLIDFLDKNDCFDAARSDKEAYAQLLLYFEVQAPSGEFYPFFLVNPFPGKRQDLGGGNVAYPVGIILNKFAI